MIRSNHVDGYLERLRPERSPLMQEMEAHAERDDIPIVHWETGRFLATLMRALAPQAVLEVGTAIGYSTLHMAEAMDSGRIVTIERDPERAAQARAYLDRGGVGDRVEIVEGDALEAISDLEGPFDVLFVDATKWESEDYLKLAGPLLSPRAVLLVDNLLMSGEVALPEDAETRWRAQSLEAARGFNSWLMQSDEWLGSVLPVGDGLGFAVRR